MVLRKEIEARSKTYAATFWEIKNETTMWKSWRSYFPHTVKLHFLQPHLEFFSGSMGALSDEHSERIHQDTTRVNER